MSNRQLTQRQKKLLYQLVDHQQNGRLHEPFGLIPIGASEYAIYLRYQTSMHVYWASDLDVLCVYGYLDYKWNRMSNAKLYSVSKTAQQLFKSGQLAINEQPSTENQLIKDRLDIQPVIFSAKHTIQRNRISLLQAADELLVILKQELGETLEGVVLGDAIAEITAVQDMYYMILPETAVIDQSLHRLSQHITDQLIAATTTEGKLAAAQTLVSFSSWTHIIFQLLLETEQQLGRAI